MGVDPRYLFGVPGTFNPTEDWPEDERHLHQGGLDEIASASDPITALTGGIGLDPFDVYPSEETQLDIEPKELPQWGPPFVKFVDDRITELEKRVIRELEKWQFQTRTDFFIASMNTDGSGNISLAVQPNAALYEPPPGFTFALHRLGIFVGASSPNFGNPYTNAGSWWELRINGETIDGGSMVSGQGSLPVVRTWGTRDALRVRDGEVLSFFMQGGPTPRNIYIKGQGSLDRTIEG